MIVDDSVVYMKMPFLTPMLPEPRPWIKVDLEAAPAAGRADLTQFTQLGQGDPTPVLELLRGVTRSVKDLGDEDVRGAGTTHYETVLDLSKVVDEVPDSVRSLVQSLIARAGTTDVRADVWIDAAGRMRKMSYEVDVTSADAEPAPSRPDTMEVTMELYEFGVPVDVSPPSDDQVVDLLELSQGRQGPS